MYLPRPFPTFITPVQYSLRDVTEGSDANGKLAYHICFVSVEMTKSAKNMQVSVIQKVIILDFYWLIFHRNNKKTYELQKIPYIFTLYSL